MAELDFMIATCTTFGGNYQSSTDWKQWSEPAWKRVAR